MLIWVSILILIAVAAWFLSLPLRRTGLHEKDAATADLELFRLQIQEIDQDRASGALTDEEADALRVEVGRRMLALSRSQSKHQDTNSGHSDGGRKLAAIAITALMPALVLGLYVVKGSPHLPSSPYANRIAEREAMAEQIEYASALDRLEKIMNERPDDPKGWQLLAQGYGNFGRYEEAAGAYRKAIALGEPSAGLFSGLGEVLTLQNKGVVSQPSREAFGRALEIEPGHIRSRYYLALDKGVNGDRDVAVQELEQILSDSNIDAAQAKIVANVIEQFRSGTLDLSQDIRSATKRGPTEQDVVDAEALDQDSRQQMIEGMVAGLANKLEQEPSDPDGWIMLVRSLRVLGREDDAVGAIAKARAHFKSEPEILSKINSAFEAM